MISYEQALNLITSQISSKPQSLNLPIAKALGHVADQAVNCACYISPFDNSAMDGFAFRYAELQQGRRQFAVVGSSFAGDTIDQSTEGAWEIMTGAGIPNGFDTVIKIEDIAILVTNEAGRPTKIKLNINPKDIIFENNVRKKGQDFKPDDLVVEADEVITPSHISALASVGIANIRVRKKPNIAVISTGKEIIDDANMALLSGQIRNSNGPSLMASFAGMNLAVSYAGTIRDEVEDFETCIKGLLNDNDIIISTGAVSMGRHDFIPESLQRLGAEIIFHKCKIRPGKPILFAKFPPTDLNPDGVFYFGLPGNPVSAHVGLRFFIMPLINRLLGLKAEHPVRAFLTADIDKKHDFKMFYKAFATLENGHLSVTILQGQESFRIKPLLKANCWAVLGEHQHKCATGGLIDIYPMMANQWSF
ncbi:MAG: molybdopterin molybdotransferase MoeA [Rhizobiales bacterium]|nr:molybdopterin molybdotransferase MoeA [Hyphomicrobiales bacterium]NRB15404.1 molybdopterin molybdotransferase MoeA [Hyphomicrobiales bacterium]